MDLAKTLIGCVTRAFHETKHILVIDALIVHSALRDDDLAHLLGMQTKELRKLCAYLEEVRLLAVYVSYYCFLPKSDHRFVGSRGWDTTATIGRNSEKAPPVPF